MGGNTLDGSPVNKYEKLFGRLQKQYEDKLLKSHSLLTQYQVLTQQHSSLANKKNTLIDVMEKLGDKLGDKLGAPEVENGTAGKTERNGKTKANGNGNGNGNGHSNGTAEKEKMTNEKEASAAVALTTEQETATLQKIISLDPRLKVKLERILNDDYEDDTTLESLKEWAGILEHSDEPVGTWLKKFLSTWKRDGKRSGDKSGSRPATKKRKTDSTA